MPSRSVALQMPEEMYEALVRIAIANGGSVSSHIRRRIAKATGLRHIPSTTTGQERRVRPSTMRKYYATLKKREEPQDPYAHVKWKPDPYAKKAQEQSARKDCVSQNNPDNNCTSNESNPTAKIDDAKLASPSERNPAEPQ